MKNTYSLLEEKASKAVQHPVICMAVIALAVIASFFPTFGNELMTGWDDQWQVTNSFTSSGFTWNNLQAIFTESYQGQYSPLNQCMYTLLYAWGGYAPVYYHTACLLLHLANCLLVWVLLNKILRDRSSLLNIQIAWIAFLTTMLFAIHPLQVETIAWVSASKILLSTFFYLIATCSFIAFIKTFSKLSYFLTFVFFICSYGAKEQALVFPIWLVVLYYMYGVKIKDYKKISLLVPFFMMALCFGLVFIYNISNPRMEQVNSNATSYSIGQRLVFSCYVIVEYLTKWFAPFKLLYLYPYPMRKGEALPLWMLIYPLLLTIAVTVFRSELIKKYIFPALLFFLIHILLVLHIIPINRFSIVSDRYIYLSSVGLAFIEVYLFAKCYKKWTLRNKRIAYLLVVLLYIGLGGYSYQRTCVWHNTDSLKKEILELSKKKKVPFN